MVAVPAVAVVQEMHHGTHKHQQEGEDAEQVGAMLRDQEEARHRHEADQDDPEGKAPPWRCPLIVIHGSPVPFTMTGLPYIIPIGPIFMESATFFCSSLNEA